MEKNAIIKATLGDLLEILDARTIVYIYTSESNNIKYSTPVYELLADYSFIKKYYKYEVIGLNKTLNSTSILIEEV